MVELGFDNNIIKTEIHIKLKETLFVFTSGYLPQLPSVEFLIGKILNFPNRGQITGGSEFTETGKDNSLNGEK